MPAGIARLPRLEQLDLARCTKLRDVRALERCRQLETLDLRDVPGWVFRRKMAESLERLFIEEAVRLRTLPREILNLKGLRWLRLHRGIVLPPEIIDAPLRGKKSLVVEIASQEQ